MIARSAGRSAWPGLFFGLAIGALVSACGSATEAEGLSADACQQTFTPVSEIQGRGDRSPLADETVTVRGIVTHIADNGLYLEQPDSDDDVASSNGLFLSLADSAATPGQWLVAQGRVAELGGGDTLTALVDISAHQLCEFRSALPATLADLPLDARQRESLESMRLRLAQSLVISNSRDIGRGDVLLSLDSMLPAATEVARPGADARAQAAANRLRSIEARLDESDRAPVPAGTQVFSVQGVLAHDGKDARLLVEEAAHLRAPPRYRVTPPEPGDLRVLSLNLQNYFNGDGQGRGFPTPRGAETPAEFKRQRERLAGQVRRLAPHIVAVMELENDGFGPHSAAADFASDLEQVTGERWLPALPWDGPIGDDHITVGIFYQASRLQAVGPAEVLTGPDFDRLSRQPLAQPFRDRNSGEDFVVVVNHLKSKGSCPQSGRNSNVGDGQGCWNAARTSAAKTMARWALAVGEAAGDGRVLVLGDMNAYRMEEPITAIIEAGLRDLTAPSGPRPHFSYIYYGEAGTLDHAFASPALQPAVRSARILNINSVWPPGQSLPARWLGASDHDPVLVDLRFRSASTRD